MNNLHERLGMALVVSGPSGTGKSTICSAITQSNTNLNFSVSCTTRKPRHNEIDGLDYYFISHDDFESKKNQNLFIEYAEVHGNYYGTLRSEIVDRVERGEDVLLDIDVQGAMQIKKYAMSDSLVGVATEYVFIAPPNMNVLEKRLRSRGTEKENVVQVRLSNAVQELAKWREYDYLIVNEKLEKALNEFQSLYNSMLLKTSRLKNLSFENNMERSK